MESNKVRGFIPTTNEAMDSAQNKQWLSMSKQTKAKNKNTLNSISPILWTIKWLGFDNGCLCVRKREEGKERAMLKKKHILIVHQKR